MVSSSSFFTKKEEWNLNIFCDPHESWRLVSSFVSWSCKAVLCASVFGPPRRRRRPDCRTSAHPAQAGERLPTQCPEFSETELYIGLRLFRFPRLTLADRCFFPPLVSRLQPCRIVKRRADLWNSDKMIQEIPVDLSFFGLTTKFLRLLSFSVS